MALSPDTFDQKTPDESRTVYISDNGDDAFDGNTPAKPCKTHTQALVLAAAKTPEQADPITVKNFSSGAFTDNIVGATDIRFEEPSIQLIHDNAGTPAIAAATRGTYGFHTIANSLGDAVTINNSTFVKVEANIISSGDIGITNGGTSDNTLIEANRIQAATNCIANTSTATGLSLTAEVEDLMIDTNSGAVISHTGAGSSSISASYIGIVRTGGAPTGVTGILISDGEVFVRVNEINCATSLTVNSGATLNIFANKISGDITVNSGGTLNIFCAELSSGTVTNNGTLHGIIGGTAYGNFIPSSNTDSISIRDDWFLRYQFETATTVGATLNYFRVNNADRTLATILYVDLVAASESIRIDELFLQFDGFIGIQSTAETSKFILYEVTADITQQGGPTGYAQIPVVSRQSVGAAFSADENCRILFIPRSVKRKTVLASFASDLVDHVKVDQDAVNQIVARVQVPNDEMAIDTCEVNFYTSAVGAGQMHIAVEDDSNTYWNQSFANSVDAENTETLGTILVTPAASGSPLDLRILASVDSASGGNEGRIGWIRFSGRVR